MKQRNTYFLVLTCLAVAMLAACSHNKHKEQDWNITLKHKDKKPYGTWLCQQSLKYYFPGVKTTLLSGNFRLDNMDDNMTYHGDSAALMVLAGYEFNLLEKEKDKMLQFASEGNEVILFCSEIDSKLESVFGCTKYVTGKERQSIDEFNPDANGQNYVTLTGSPVRYRLEGRSLISYFALDTADAPVADTGMATDYIETEPVAVSEDYDNKEIRSSASVLGSSSQGPDFIRYNVGSGHITLHAAPLVLSNYFLMQPGHRSYLDGIWHSMPANISHIYWIEFFSRKIVESEPSSLLQYPPIRWAFWILIAMLLVYVLFEGKRRQRIIPIIQPPVNSSVSFAETVGRLYYNKGNHQNLAEKMVQHFLEWVRSNYYLNTAEINEIFTHQLTVKSGISEATVREMVQMIHEIKTRSVQVDEAYLYHLHATIQQFYKNR